LIKKMLVAIDGSESSAKALDFAIELAEKWTAKVQIVSVVQPVESLIPRFTFAAPPPEFYAFFIKHVEDRIERTLSTALNKAKNKNPNLTVSTRMLKGRPADKIVETAKNEDFDLIIVGSRGLGGVDDLILGSVSDRIADNATCSVLIVK
jgi:nucleotide-binding universal stress UspA family protein